VPQAAQTASSRAPHCPQNFAPAELSWPHREHCIQWFSTVRRVWFGKWPSIG
jgi:hypothetical protein